MKREEILEIEAYIEILQDCDTGKITVADAAQEMFQIMRRAGKRTLGFALEVSPTGHAVLKEVARLIEESPLPE